MRTSPVAWPTSATASRSPWPRGRQRSHPARPRRRRRLHTLVPDDRPSRTHGRARHPGRPAVRRRRLLGPVLDEAEQAAPAHYAGNNGWVVAGLQGAWSALSRTNNLRDALIAGGGATDTVAATAGGLAGAAYGRSAVPVACRRDLHGWPGLRSRDLIRLAVLTTRSERPHSDGWPTGEQLSADDDAATRTVPHPDDPGVLLGAVGALRPGRLPTPSSACAESAIPRRRWTASPRRNTSRSGSSTQTTPGARGADLRGPSSTAASRWREGRPPDHRLVLDSDAALSVLPGGVRRR